MKLAFADWTVLYASAATDLAFDPRKAGDVLLRNLWLDGLSPDEAAKAVQFR